VETVAVAFINHLSVVIRLYVDVPFVPRGKGLWKMSTFILSEEAFKESWVRSRRFGGSREGTTPIGPCGGEGIKKDFFLYSGRVQTSAGLRKDG